jgi:hypothetical protein
MSSEDLLYDILYNPERDEAEEYYQRERERFDRIREEADREGTEDHSDGYLGDYVDDPYC